MDGLARLQRIRAQFLDGKWADTGQSKGRLAAAFISVFTARTSPGFLVDLQNPEQEVNLDFQHWTS
jgi:hypothetical protein